MAESTQCLKNNFLKKKQPSKYLSNRYSGSVGKSVASHADGRSSIPRLNRRDSVKQVDDKTRKGVPCRNRCDILRTSIAQ